MECHVPDVQCKCKDYGQIRESLRVAYTQCLLRFVGENEICLDTLSAPSETSGALLKPIDVHVAYLSQYVRNIHSEPQWETFDEIQCRFCDRSILVLWWAPEILTPDELELENIQHNQCQCL